MSTRREKHFECTLSAGDIETTVHVSAWDARSAEELFREALLAAGIRVAGTIRIRDPKGRLAREARFEPTSRESVAQG
jgi:hypothetical protein